MAYQLNKWLSAKEIGIYGSLLIFSMFVGVITKIYLTDTITNYSDHQQLLNVIISSVLGLLVIITMFYLGKFHDYRKDFLVINSKIISSQTVYITKLNQLKKLQIELKQIQLYDKYIKKTNKQFHNIDDVLELAENMGKIYDVMDDVKEFIFSGTKPIQKLLLLIPLFTTIFFIINLAYSQTEGNFYFHLCMIGAGILHLLVFWIIYERTMNFLHGLYNASLKAKTKKEESINDAVDHISAINIILSRGADKNQTD